MDAGAPPPLPPRGIRGARLGAETEPNGAVRLDDVEVDFDVCDSPDRQGRPRLKMVDRLIQLSSEQKDTVSHRGAPHGGFRSTTWRVKG